MVAKQQMITYAVEESTALTELLSDVTADPYKSYCSFRDEVEDLVRLGESRSPHFVKLCQSVVADRRNGLNVHLVKNCVIDKDVPIYDSDDPVTSKYRKKETFVAEGFLLLFSLLTKTPILGYETRNNGDMYQDVFAQSKYSGTQTQKTDGELYFHNDRTAHRIRAEFLYLLGMRANPQNLCFTGYVDGRSLLENIPGRYQNVLREDYFYTPFDLYSSDTNPLQQQSEPHNILFDEHSFRYYDSRTTFVEGAPDVAKEALLVLKNAILLSDKHYVRINRSDMLCIPNQRGLHCRLNMEIPFPDDHKNRYLLKTYNFESLESCARYQQDYVKNIPGLVKEL